MATKAIKITEGDEFDTIAREVSLAMMDTDICTHHVHACRYCITVCVCMVFVFSILLYVCLLQSNEGA